MITQVSTGGRSGAGRERGGMLSLKPDMASLARARSTSRTGSTTKRLISSTGSPRKCGARRQAGDRSIRPVDDLLGGGLQKSGKVKGPLHVQFVMGVKNAMPVDHEVFEFYVKTLNRVAPGATWTGAGIGKDQLKLAVGRLNSAAIAGRAWRTTCASTRTRWRRRTRRLLNKSLTCAASTDGALRPPPRRASFLAAARNGVRGGQRTSTAAVSETAPAARVGIVGAGSIGIAFALVFARAGWRVALYDPDEVRRRLVLAELRARTEDLLAYGLLTEPVEQIVARVAVVATLETAVRDAQLVQECAPELLELKRQLFAEIDAAAPSDAVLASSSSALPASSFAAELAGRGRCLVAHPGNPPYLLRVIEIVPAPFTQEESSKRAEQLFRAAGLIPVPSRAKSKASSSTASRGPCYERPTAWSATASHRWKTSTPS